MPSRSVFLLLLLLLLLRPCVCLIRYIQPAFRQLLLFPPSLLICYNMVGFTPTTPKFVVLAAKKSQKFPHMLGTKF
jgi:hypothetical protein